jgi:membrane-bound lytic murein transglycosylase D
MSETGLREINRIPARMLVTKGSTLLVPRTASRDQDVSEHLADNARIGFAPDVPPMRRVTLKANKGDTVASVARRHRLGTTQLAQWNRVSTKATFKPGQQIVVYVREGQTLASVEPSGNSKASAKSGKVTKVASTASGKAKAGAKTRSAKVASGDGKGARTVSTKTALR